jgi:hypothetical protein
MGNDLGTLAVAETVVAEGVNQQKSVRHFFELLSIISNIRKSV